MLSDKTMALAGIGMLISAAGATAQTAKAPNNSATDQALKKAQGMLRQVSEEKQALVTEKTQLQTKVDALEAQLKQMQALQGEVERQRNSAEALRSANQGLSGQLQQSRLQERSLGGQLQESSKLVDDLKSDNAHLLAASQEREQREQDCLAKNRQLLAAGQAMLERIDNKSLWEKLLEAEPVTGIANVERELQAQDYRFKLEDLKAAKGETKTGQN